jgi:hypothetical protein
MWLISKKFGKANWVSVKLQLDISQPKNCFPGNSETSLLEKKWIWQTVLKKFVAILNATPLFFQFI